MSGLAMWADELPEPYVCVICQRDVQPNRWRLEIHRPPICHYCSISGGHKVRIPGMTRGDHHVLQRLVTITERLGGEALWRQHGWK